MEKAEKTIRRYLDRLDPANFKSLARVFFSFKNHAKIIKTDKIAYVGSANFSDESQGNWEAGVILRDPTVLTAIEAVIDELEKDSIRYFGGKMQNVVSPIIAAREELSEVLEQFSNWPTKENRRTFIGILKGIDDSFNEIDNLWTSSFVRTGPISSLVDREVLERIGSKLRDFDHIDNLIAKAEDGDIDFDLVEVNKDGEIPEWGFEIAIDSMDRQRDEEIAAIREHVGEFIAQIEAACSQISNNVTQIDNTPRKDQPSG
jgi:hypothetical protein